MNKNSIDQNIIKNYYISDLKKQIPEIPESLKNKITKDSRIFLQKPQKSIISFLILKIHHIMKKTLALPSTAGIPIASTLGIAFGLYFSVEISEPIEIIISEISQTENMTDPFYGLNLEHFKD